MNCRNVLHLLSAYMDGELRGVEHRLVHDHLAYCPECEAEYQEILSTKRLLGRMRLQMPREELSELILQSISGEERRQSERRLTHWLPRFSRLLRASLPGPRLMFTGTGLGIATALILAYTIVPDDEMDIKWVPADVAQNSILPAAPSGPNSFHELAGENWLRSGQPVSNPSISPAPYSVHPSIMPVSTISPPFLSTTGEAIDARRGWHRIH